MRMVVRMRMRTRTRRGLQRMMKGGRAMARAMVTTQNVNRMRILMRGMEMLL
jgi:hypothetical protein